MIDEESNVTESVYSQLEIKVGLRKGLFSLCVWSAMLLIVIFFGAETFGLPQQIVGFVSFITALVLILYPLSEEYVYQPWQKAVRKVERHAQAADSDVIF